MIICNLANYTTNFRKNSFNFKITKFQCKLFNLKNYLKKQTEIFFLNSVVEYKPRSIGKKHVFPTNRTKIIFQFGRGKSYPYNKDSTVREKMKYCNVIQGSIPPKKEVS